MGAKNCIECKWCVRLRGILGLDCEWYRMYFDDTERAATCPHYETDEEED